MLDYNAVYLGQNLRIKLWIKFKKLRQIVNIDFKD
jgi:hypothetical protein